MRNWILAAAAIGCAVAWAPVPVAAETDTIARLRGGDESLRIGYREDAPPFSEKLTPEQVAARRPSSDGGQVAPAIGYTMDLCKLVIEEIRAEIGKDLTIEYVQTTASDRFELLADGQIDLLCGATTFTLERQRRFDFSLLTFVSASSVLHRSGDTPRGFFGAKVGVIQGSTSLDILRQEIEGEQPPIEVIEVVSHDDGLNFLRRGEIDSYFGDRVLLRQFALEGDGSFKLSRLRLSNEPYALPVRKGDVELLFLVNRALAKAYAGGDEAPIYAIFERWFGGARPDDTIRALYSVMAVQEGRPQ